MNELEEFKITPIQMNAIKLLDIDKLKNKKCAQKMNISIQEFNEIVSSAREVIYRALIEGKRIIVVEQKINSTENKVKTMCKFRCEICGQLYNIDYTNDKIVCPLCFSTKVIHAEEAGF